MTESAIEKKTVEALAKLNVMSTRVAGRGVNGVPDLVLHYEGLTCWLEMKTLTGRISPVQVGFKRRAAKHGVTVLVAYGVSDAITKVIDEFGITLCQEKVS